MAYLHEVSFDWSDEQLVGLRHYRESRTPGGVVVLTELARTLPMFSWSLETERQSGLIMPSTDIVMQANLERDEEFAPSIFSCQ